MRAMVLRRARPDHQRAALTCRRHRQREQFGAAEGFPCPRRISGPARCRLPLPQPNVDRIGPDEELCGQLIVAVGAVAAEPAKFLALLPFVRPADLSYLDEYGIENKESARWECEFFVRLFDTDRVLSLNEEKCENMSRFLDAKLKSDGVFHHRVRCEK